ncbi:alpha/beta hydrolase [Microlunatus aurantiacus]|uniref:Alpha/beta hydrolase n=1 Tax=Microlunatus aurantiacus TaxID=446786 RepID=A0ABP7D5M3_9ACTN
MSISSVPRQARRRVGAALTALALAAALVLLPTASSASGGGRSGSRPTIVLVHGAFADASVFADVTNRLQRRGYTVIAPANPLRGLASDAAYVASVLATIQGPIILGGHSYGGEVITNAAFGNANVEALVYVAAFAPRRGRDRRSADRDVPGEPPHRGEPGPPAVPRLRHRRATTPTSTRGSSGASSAPISRRRRPTRWRPPSDPARWRRSASTPGRLPGPPSRPGTWWRVRTGRSRPPPQRFMATRMKAHTREVNSSHVAMISHPDVVADLIVDADRGTR